MSVISRLSLDIALTERNSGTAMDVTQALCTDFKGDICPIGKDAAFYICIYAVCFINFNY